MKRGVGDPAMVAGLGFRAVLARQRKAFYVLRTLDRRLKYFNQATYASACSERT